MARESFPNFFKRDVIEAVDRLDNVTVVAKLYRISPKVVYNWINNEERILRSDPLASRITNMKKKPKPNPNKRWNK